MKTKLLLVLLIAINLLSCSKENNDEENPPFSFQVEVNSITDRSAIVTWTKPEGLNVRFQIFLDNELVEDNISQTAYT